MKRIIYLILPLVLMTQHAFAWTWLNHVVIAESAHEQLSSTIRAKVDQIADAIYDDLTDSTKSKLDNYTGASKFARLAALPDIVRNWHLKTVYDEFQGTIPAVFQSLEDESTASWHYINLTYPYESSCNLIVSPNIIEVLPLIEQAYEQGADNQSKGIALAFLLHMVGDAHQPLHTVAKANSSCVGDKGGNDFCLRRSASGNCTKKLHAFWDEAGGQFNDNNQVLQYSSELMSEYPAEELTDEDNLDFTVWIDEGRILAPLAYSTPTDVGADDDYDRYVEKLTRQRMALAATRLAALIEQLVSSL